MRTVIAYGLAGAAIVVLGFLPAMVAAVWPCLVLAAVLWVAVAVVFLGQVSRHTRRRPARPRKSWAPPAPEQDYSRLDRFDGLGR